MSAERGTIMELRKACVHLGVKPSVLKKLDNEGKISLVTTGSSTFVNVPEAEKAISEAGIEKQDLKEEDVTKIVIGKRIRDKLIEIGFTENELKWVCKISEDKLNLAKEALGNNYEMFIKKLEAIQRKHRSLRKEYDKRYEETHKEVRKAYKESHKEEIKEKRKARKSGGLNE